MKLENTDLMVPVQGGERWNVNLDEETLYLTYLSTVSKQKQENLNLSLVVTPSKSKIDFIHLNPKWKNSASLNIHFVCKVYYETQDILSIIKPVLLI